MEEMGFSPANIADRAMKLVRRRKASLSAAR
jgi:hypothetical protein